MGYDQKNDRIGYPGTFLKTYFELPYKTHTLCNFRNFGGFRVCHIFRVFRVFRVFRAFELTFFACVFSSVYCCGGGFHCFLHACLLPPAFFFSTGCRGRLLDHLARPAHRWGGRRLRKRAGIGGGKPIIYFGSVFPSFFFFLMKIYIFRGGGGRELVSRFIPPPPFF